MQRFHLKSLACLFSQSSGVDRPCGYPSKCDTFSLISMLPLTKVVGAHLRFFLVHHSLYGAPSSDGDSPHMTIPCAGCTWPHTHPTLASLIRGFLVGEGLFAVAGVAPKARFVLSIYPKPFVGLMMGFYLLTVGELFVVQDRRCALVASTATWATRTSHSCDTPNGTHDYFRV